jgi:hypothetical protein
MRSLQHAMLLGAMALLAGSPAVAQGGASSPQASTKTRIAATGPSVTEGRTQLEGLWVYNEVESLNAANGRREGAAGSRIVGAAGGTRSGGRSGGGGFGAGGTGYGGYGFGGPVGGNAGNPTFASLIVNERRDLMRDLLEVPVELAIKVTADAVTITDDLDREHTYPTTGRKQKYQLSASVFEARSYWDGAHFKKDIEGTEGFRMQETYFVSEDGQRLFVILRVGDPQDKTAPIVGVNRVYDRIGAR